MPGTSNGGKPGPFDGSVRPGCGGGPRTTATACPRLQQSIFVHAKRPAPDPYSLVRALISDAIWRLEFHGNRFYLGVLLQTIFAEFTADTRLLESAERGRRIEDVIAIDPHRTRADAVGDGMGLGDVPSPNGGG